MKYTSFYKANKLWFWRRLETKKAENYYLTSSPKHPNCKDPSFWCFFSCFLLHFFDFIPFFPFLKQILSYINKKKNWCYRAQCWIKKLYSFQMMESKSKFVENQNQAHLHKLKYYIILSLTSIDQIWPLTSVAMVR